MKEKKYLVEIGISEGNYATIPVKASDRTDAVAKAIKEYVERMAYIWDGASIHIGSVKIVNTYNVRLNVHDRNMVLSDFYEREVDTDDQGEAIQQTLQAFSEVKGITMKDGYRIHVIATKAS